MRSSFSERYTYVNLAEKTNRSHSVVLQDWWPSLLEGFVRPLTRTHPHHMTEKVSHYPILRNPSIFWFHRLRWGHDIPCFSYLKFPQVVSPGWRIVASVLDFLQHPIGIVTFLLKTWHRLLGSIVEVLTRVSGPYRVAISDILISGTGPA